MTFPAGRQLVTSLVLLFLTELGSIHCSDSNKDNNGPSRSSNSGHTSNYDGIHHRMSQSDLRRVFQVHSHDEVPEYDVVHLRVVSKRSTDEEVASSSASSSPKEIYLRAFGEDLTLNLQPNHEFNQRLKSLRLFSAETTQDARRVAYVDDGPILSEDDDVGETYHDDRNMAAILVRQSPTTGRLLLDGTIGNELVIRPVPSQVLVGIQPPPPTPTSSNNQQANDETPSSSDSASYMSSRDDDEIFLEDEDDVSVSQLNHLKSRSKKSNFSSKKVHSKGSSSPSKNNSNNKGITSSRSKKDDERIKTRKANNSFNLTSSNQTSSTDRPKIITSETTRSRRSSVEEGRTTPLPVSSSSSDRHQPDMYHTHAHFVFKKPQTTSHKSWQFDDEVASPSPPTSGPSFDFAHLEPGHHSPALNWSLVPSPSSSNKYSRESNEDPSSPPRILRRNKRQSPDTVWPEVLLVVDYDSYILHGGNSRDVKRYFISFWNGVDLRYKLLSHPRIRVSLAGMIVAKDRDATPYLERNRLRSPNADAVDAAGALTDMGKYLYREDRLPTYDLAVVITKLDMCRRRYEGGRCNRGTAGFAYVGGACVVNKRLEKVNSVAIIEDSGGFSGIIVAAHEVGHLLGCVHDGSPPPSYLGGPGATRCPWEDGFIMSDLRHTERGFRWSSCSVEQFKHFLNGETATCLYNYPHENQLLPRVLPGTMLTLDEQCKRDRGTNACFKDARVCAQLFCFDSASGYCVSYRPAAEGSSCGDGQVCRNGKCAAELENIIPDYTHVTQTVVSQGHPAPPPDHLLSRADSPSYPTSVGPPIGSLSLSPYNEGTFDVLNDGPAPSLPSGRGGRSFDVNSDFNSQPLHVTSVVNHNRKKSSSCRDIIDKLAGSLSCSEFLDRFGYRYCNHSYVKRNCCASHAIICNKSAK